ncbi:hypothetical protein BAXH7_01006 [Bacillus amyloliquefaciens XH7]|nr:hypothetical protein LL3_01111 [Bacillus amyloliquefaciens LL3]AEK88148.1 hypothetical protein BAXH7_01006 [Bacillus amyloliquefaciens XH7]KYC92722.1 hypothetical protein B425_1054 [Bacillus amyloliquefaciens]
MIPAVKKGAAHLRMCSALLLHILYFQAIVTNISIAFMLFSYFFAAFRTLFTG